MTLPHSARTSSLRPIGLPHALSVREDQDHRPLAVARTDAYGRSKREALVESVEDMWRLAEAWWREAAQQRTYYRVLLEDDRPLTLYRDEVSGSWYEQPYSAGGSEEFRSREFRRQRVEL